MDTINPCVIYDRLEQELSASSEPGFYPVLEEDRNFEIYLSSLELFPSAFDVAYHPDPLAEMQFKAQTDTYLNRFPGAWHRIIRCRGDRVGRVWIHASATRIVLVEITLEPQSRRRGYGSLIVNKLTALSDYSGIPLELSVVTHNQAAIHLYSKRGLAITGRSDTHLTMAYLPKR